MQYMVTKSLVIQYILIYSQSVSGSRNHFLITTLWYYNYSYFFITRSNELKLFVCSWYHCTNWSHFCPVRSSQITLITVSSEKLIILQQIEIWRNVLQINKHYHMRLTITRSTFLLQAHLWLSLLLAWVTEELPVTKHRFTVFWAQRTLL